MLQLQGGVGFFVCSSPPPIIFSPARDHCWLVNAGASGDDFVPQIKCEVDPEHRSRVCRLDNPVRVVVETRRRTGIFSAGWWLQRSFVSDYSASFVLYWSNFLLLQVATTDFLARASRITVDRSRGNLGCSGPLSPKQI